MSWKKREAWKCSFSYDFQSHRLFQSFIAIIYFTQHSTYGYNDISSHGAGATFSKLPKIFPNYVLSFS